MREWEVYPAIDLRRGNVVRLRQGDPTRETIYDDDPLAAALRWRSDGARWLHVVNLDGAFGEESTPNQRSLERILTAGLSVQFGGGLRDMDALRRALALGVRRAVIGTAAVEQPELVAAAVEEFGPERLAVAIDARKGRVTARGWAQDSSLEAADVLRRCVSQGATRFIATNVERDGMPAGLDITWLKSLLAVADGGPEEVGRTLAQSKHTVVPRIIASGGVAGLDDLRAALDAGLAGVIIGRALYEGQVSLREAVALC